MFVAKLESRIIEFIFFLFLETTIGLFHLFYLILKVRFKLSLELKILSLLFLMFLLEILEFLRCFLQAVYALLKLIDLLSFGDQIILELSNFFLFLKLL